MVVLSLASGFLSSLLVVLEPVHLLILLIGVILGMIIGTLPGMGGSVALALLTPVTFGLNQEAAFILLMGAYGATTFSGSITSILFGIPGSAASIATVLDGYELGKQGKAGYAIGASAAASAFGSVIGLVFLLGSIPIMLEIIILFGPPEIFWLGLWGVVITAVVMRGETLLGLISGLLGLVIGMHGVTITGAPRWTYDAQFLYTGFNVAVVIVGLFAISEMLHLSFQGTKSVDRERLDQADLSGRVEGVKAVYRHKWVFLRSALLGTFIGIIPGIGAVTATYFAYFQAVAAADDSSEFGSGDIRGVIAPESSNDAKDASALIPTLGFGIPGSASMAVLFGALILHGIDPGPRLLEDNLDIVLVIISALFLTSFLTSSIGFATANIIQKIGNIDVYIVVPVIIAISILGVYSIGNNIYNVFIAVLFGILGYVMINIDMSRVPMVLAIVLQDIIESNFFRTLQISDYDPTAFVDSPISVVIVLLVIGSILYPIVKPLIEVVRSDGG